MYFNFQKFYGTQGQKKIVWSIFCLSSFKVKSIIIISSGLIFNGNKTYSGNLLKKQNKTLKIQMKSPF